MDAHGRYIIPCRELSYMYRVYLRLPTYGNDICHAWAFCVVRLGDFGQCESLEQWDGQRRIPRIFYRSKTLMT